LSPFGFAKSPMEKSDEYRIDFYGSLWIHEKGLEREGVCLEKN
jgi:hypothetical protein